MTSQDQVNELVARVFAAIRTPFDCMGHHLTTDASIGIALAPGHGTALDQILKNADLAMYAAKAAGRRTYRFFEPEMDAKVRERRQLEIDLRHAIALAASRSITSPASACKDDRITGCEALVRWRHPERGMVSPAEFIPIAEDTGLINEIGEWVLATACRDAAGWPDDIRLAVNVSPVQFKSGTLALKIMAALAASNLPASRLELEITEAVLIRDDETALAILHQLRAHRRPHRARRFRHRLLVAELSAPLPVRQDQDRPLLRQRHRRPRRLCQHRAGRGQSRQPPAAWRRRPKASRPRNSSGCCARSAAPRCRAICSAPQSRPTR